MTTHDDMRKYAESILTTQNSLNRKNAALILLAEWILRLLREIESSKKDALK